MTPELTTRIAETMGWSEKDVHSFSLPTLREFVRHVSPKLAHEIQLAMDAPTYIAEPPPKKRRRR